MNNPSSNRPLIYIVATKLDAEWRDAIHAELEAQAGTEFEVWSRGQNLRPGSEWKEEMQRARRQAAGGVVILSNRSVSSEYVREEIGHLDGLHVPLFPIVVEECEWQMLTLIAGLTIFDEARPLNTHPAEIQPRKIEEFARVVLAALREEHKSRSPETEPGERYYASDERESRLTRGEMGPEQRDQADEARLRQWRMRLSDMRRKADELRARMREGTLRPSELNSLLETAAEFQKHIKDWFETEQDVTEEGRSIILTLQEYEAQFREMLVPLLLKPSSVAPQATDGASLSLDLFSPISRRALGWADAFRKSLDQRHVHIEHLIAAIYQSHDDRVIEVFNKAGVNWVQLLSILHESESNIPTIPRAIRLEADEAIKLPLLSNNARSALERGIELARTENSLPAQPHHLLFGALSLERAAVAVTLQNRGLRLELLKQKTDSASARIGRPRSRTYAGHDIPGVSSDVAKGVDLLNIEAEVAALCSVIASRDVQPPLSIGLFGDWGTGKSFFMEKMWERIAGLKTDGGDGESPFCSHIVQLKFNAWYYIDTNLWATLGSEIFRGLANALAEDEEQPARARERLLAATASQRDVLAEAERQKQLASEQLKQSEARLVQLKNSEAELDQRLRKPSFLLRSAYRVAVGDSKVQAKVREAAEILNISSVEAAATNTKAQLMELHGLVGAIRAMWLAARQRKGITLLWLLAALLIIAIPYALTGLTEWAKNVHLDTAMARTSALLAGLVTLVAPLGKKVRQALKFINEAREQSVQIVEEETRKQEKELREEKKKVQAEAVGLQERIDEGTKTLAKLEQELRALQADRQMCDFVKTRNESRDYVSHLGVIARAREDFQRLSDLLGRVQKQVEDERNGTPNGEKLLLPRIDRIILYIDDLDRCPEDKVVDVLQAIHLLLAFPLFVVVVGVDPRWLLHSLKQHSRAFQSQANNDAIATDEERLHWQSTPLNYLEKIFQIPFSLRPMQATGFGDLITKLTEPKEDAKPAMQVDPASAPTVQRAATNEAAAAAQSRPETSAEHPPAEKASTAARSQTGEATVTPKPPVEPVTKEAAVPFRPLNLREDERKFMKDLYPFIPTPRAAKRFVNVYRLLRALSDEDEAFRGSKERAEHRAVLVLLAILIGYPGEGTELLRDLLDGQGTSQGWWKFVELYRGRSMTQSANAADHAEAQKWSSFFDKLDAVRARIDEEGSCVDFHESCDAFIKWAGEVARFSFQSARVVLQRRGAET